MTQFPSLPLFTDAFLADTAHLTAHETGAYLLLLMMAWRMPGGRLPDDDAKLCRWARVDPGQWHFTKRKVMEFWRYEENHEKPTGLADVNEIKGFWTQKRLAHELLRVSEMAARSRANGQRGGRPKLLKTNDEENPAGSFQATQTKAPNPSPIKERKEKKEMNRVWVARDTPEWTAWQRVKRRESVWSPERQQNGFWFETQWPPDPTPSPATKEAAE